MVYSVFIRRAAGCGDDGSNWKHYKDATSKKAAYLLAAYLETMREDVRVFKGGTIGRIIYSTKI
jgi:hypothetical protein